jgi:hypothetical protein
MAPWRVGRPASVSGPTRQDAHETDALLNQLLHVVFVAPVVSQAAM